MSLAGRTVWVVGGVGVVGRGIARGLLQLGATVIVNSRSPERLTRIAKDLKYPERLVTVNGSLLPGKASDTVEEAMLNHNVDTLNHVVSHGAVRYWTTQKLGCDETFALGTANVDLLDYTPEDFRRASSQLATLHFSAAQELIPHLMNSSASTGLPSSYTFVTGDGGGHPSTLRTAMGEINTHHVWGLSAAMRAQFASSDKIVCRELRVGLPVQEEDSETVCEDIGNLCAGIVTSAAKEGENGRLVRIDDKKSLEALLAEYQAYSSFDDVAKTA
uniref:Pyrroline-5-carboxylate reductase catalytic N-terminal domain-containing protein n=1 Tax=Amphora coffeiformis TaxID=265554 RepID=A0A7S3L7J7_9STRA